MVKRIRIFLLLMLVFIFMFPISVFSEAENGKVELSEQNSLTKNEIRKIELWIEKNMKDGKIPGVSVVIVKGDKTVYNKGFGYADVSEKLPVTSETLFELGSNSKAFTALGILKLEKEGLINLDDSVKKYIPWFQMKYVGEYKGKKINGNVDITLRQLLYHTSGIPFNSIGDIPVDSSEGALEKTIRTQVGKELDFYPGEKFLYATINYDILGLIIRNVSHMSYEDYMEKDILTPLGLNNTYLFRDETTQQHFAKGYKVRFLKSVEYSAPVYRGNSPAGYIVTNTEDLANWIRIQLDTKSLSHFDKNLIDASHAPNRTVAPSSNGSSYASGWFVFQNGGGMLSHGGNNPNYSSYLVLRPQEKIGIGILTNLNSSYTEAIANGINDIMQGEKPKDNISDIYITVDNFAFAAVLISLPVLLLTIYLLVVLIIQIVKGERKYVGNSKKAIATTFILLLFTASTAYCMYNITDLLYYGLPWSFIRVWAPQSLIAAIVLLLLTVVIFCLYYLFTTVFPKRNDQSLFIISTLSIISGIGNAIVIFVVNETLNRSNGLQFGLLLFFVMGIAIYVYGQRIVRVKLLTLANNLVYDKRIHLINSILNSSYEKIEQLENGKIQAGLNNDTETISQFSNIIISAATSIVTLICCFVYLGIINIWGLLVSVLVIFIAASLYFFIGRYANKLWEETRDIQNVFFKFINSLVHGFKELKMHNKRRNEFRDDMQVCCEEYRDKRIKGDLGFANVFVIGELLFTIVIGAVAFIFPVLFEDIQTSSLRNYIFVFLYMTGPVHGVLNAIPQIIKVRISYSRINELTKELENMEVAEDYQESDGGDKNQFELELREIEYSYKNMEDEVFKVGSINCSFKSGEITFITGGNGSGKSTLAKLITGLYIPDKGNIYMNGNKISADKLRQQYSTIFYDFYLFEKLYGIDYKGKSAEISKYLKSLQIDDKLSIDNGVFNTTKLSSGQRKRAALLVSYLEDRPICLFDEWAADQDPQFKKVFYNYILPDLKARGKCLIVITHDDRYFDVADRLIKMEMGRVIETT